MAKKLVWMNPVPDEDHWGWWEVETVDHIKPPTIGATQLNIDLDSRHDSVGG
jgi:hypothetical protein